MDVLVIGCGYLGLEVASQLVRAGHQVWGVRRSIPDPTPFESAGIRPLALDITQPESFAEIPGSIQWVVNAVSSSRRGAAVYREVYLEATRSFMKWAQESGLPLEHYVHVSSSSVYGHADGSWVEESAPREPSTETSQILVETEDLLLAPDSGFPASVVRASGIYGPGRGYLFQQYLKDEATMVGDGSRLINMIHVEDLAQAIAFILNKVPPGGAINVTDSLPISQKEFFHFLSEALRKPMPPSAAPEALRARKRAITHKRVSNQKLLSHGFQFRYPSFREGYAPLIESAVGPRP